MLFKKKHEFRPDKTDSGALSKLYITKKQRLALLKWLLFALLLVFLSVVQDVMLSQVRIFGATTDLLCGALLMVCIMLDPEQGCVFILVGSTLYHFSGVSPGPYTIALLTVIGLIISIFRQAYLRRGFSALMLCSSLCMVIYEMAVFFIGLFLKQTYSARFSLFLLTAALTLLVLPAVYPILVSIGKIGGETWKE